MESTFICDMYFQKILRTNYLALSYHAHAADT